MKKIMFLLLMGYACVTYAQPAPSFPLVVHNASTNAYVVAFGTVYGSSDFFIVQPGQDFKMIVANGVFGHDGYYWTLCDLPTILDYTGGDLTAMPYDEGPWIGLQDGDPDLPGIRYVYIGANGSIGGLTVGAGAYYDNMTPYQSELAPLLVGGGSALDISGITNAINAIPDAQVAALGWLSGGEAWTWIEYGICFGVALALTGASRRLLGRVNETNPEI